jgi:TonB dependent receptor/TonB-dependent Receptor Plug Domain
MRRHVHALGLAALLAATAASAAEPVSPDLEEVVVRARRLETIASVESASQGVVLADQLENRPALRVGELLEVVPGLVVTQHSGDGKANQYFLRGFNLDHGTDFATRVDGIPVNQPTNAHGQGYSDLNFLLPDLVDRVEYRKGTYYAEEGNFSAAGAADIHYRRSVDAPLVVLSAGEDGYVRTMAAASPQVAAGDLLLGVEYARHDGPWDVAEAYGKLAGLAKFTSGDSDRGWGLEAMGYDGHWHSSDQIPLRAVEAGLIDRFGTIDPTDGGRTHRYSLSGDWWQTLGAGRLHADAFALDSALDLYSNFTYAIDPVHGDQFEQFEQRRVYDGVIDYQRPLALAGREATVRGGIEIRVDDLLPVALYRTTDDARYATVRQDDVLQLSYSAYATGGLHWTNWLRTDLGVRYDEFRFRVDSSLAANSGTADDSITSPKLTLTLGPWAKTEVFLNYGHGFHSNDARGTTITVDPNDGVTPVAKVSPLVRAIGAEAGVRSTIIPRLQVAASLWTLGLDSELVFSGDGGTTEPSRASRRTGIEFSADYEPLDGVVADADLAWTRARYVDPSALGDYIPNAIGRVVSAGVRYNGDAGWFGGARLRYFGPAPLVEDGSARSPSTTVINLDCGYQYSPRLKVTLTVFNALDRRDDDITYYYASRLPGEPAPVDDYHFHPLEPRTLRLTVTWRLR